MYRSVSRLGNCLSVVVIAVCFAKTVFAYEFDAGFNSPVIESPGGEVQTMLVDASNRIVVAGSFSSWDSQTRFNIARLNADGVVDANFSPSFDGAITKLLETASGYIAVGSFVRVNNATTSGIVALNFDGTVDTRFQLMFHGEYRDAIMLSNGNILIAGNISVAGSPQTDRSLIQITKTGAIVDDFNFFDNGISSIYAIAEASDGDIIVAGSKIVLGDQEQNGLARLNSDGSIDSEFVSPIPSDVNVFLYHVLVQPDNKVVVAGDFSSFVSESDNRVQRFLSNGELDTGFGLVAKGAVDVLFWLDGKLLIGGQLFELNRIRLSFYTLVMIDANGDTSSDFMLKVDRNRVLAIAQQQNGQLLTAGRAASGVNTPPSSSVLQRLSRTGVIDESFGQRGFMTVLDNPLAVRRMTVFSNGKIALSGFIRRVNGVDVDGIVRFNTNGTVDQGFVLDDAITQDPDVRFREVAGIQRGQQLVLSVSRNSITSYIRLLADGRLDTSFADNGFLESVSLFGVSDEAFYVAPDRFNRSTIIRHDRTGQLDTGFAPVVLNSFFGTRVIELNSGPILITGEFTTINGEARPGIAAVDQNGALLDDFRLSSNSRFNNFVIKPLVDGRFIWRSASSVLVTDKNGVERAGSSVVTDSAEHDLNFDFSEFREISAVATQCDSKVWLRGPSADGNLGARLLRYNTDGTLDTSIGEQEQEIQNGRFAPRFMEDLPDGRIALFGSQRIGLESGFEQRAALRVIAGTANEEAACYQPEELCVVIPKGAVFCL